MEAEMMAHHYLQSVIAQTPIANQKPKIANQNLLDSLNLIFALPDPA